MSLGQGVGESEPLPSAANSVASNLRQWLQPLLMVGVFVLVLALPWLGMDAYWMRQLALIAIMSLVVSGLNTTLGYGGELAVGQIALYALGAYVAGWLSFKHGVDDILVCMLVAIVAAIAIGLVSGVPGLRLGGWSLAMVTFFLVLLIPNIVNLLKGVTGGAEGLSIAPPTLLGAHLALPANGRGFYVVAVVTTFIWFTLLRNLIRSPHGSAFLVLKESPILASTLGISVYRLKLLAYVLGAIPCGIAGVLFAFLSQYISPYSFSFSDAISVLTASIVGGSQSLYGAFIGAALLKLGPEHIGSFQEYTLIVYGVFLVLAGLLFSGGIAGLVRSIGNRLGISAFFQPPVPDLELAGAGDETGEIAVELHGETLVAEGVTKVFGGLTAVDDVTVEALPGQITALIGPNGSGKTTLLNLASGFYKPTEGCVRLGSRTVSGLAPYRTARAGVARTFQTPLIPKGLTTREFVAAGRYITHHIGIAAAALRLPSHRRGSRANDAEAMRLLRLLGIAEVANRPVSELALGTRRLVEVARAMAAEPKVFLFDEVGSGLDQEDLERLERAMDLIRRAGGTVVLVEHNFPLVLKVADRVHVLTNGSLLASGTPEEIQRNSRVLEEYAGPGAQQAGEEEEDIEQTGPEPGQPLAGERN